MLQRSLELRKQAVKVLKSNETLVLEDGEKMTSENILQMVAEHYNVLPSEYCSQMEDPQAWGGGPEIVGRYQNIIFDYFSFFIFFIILFCFQL
jgi:hypothetical protein